MSPDTATRVSAACTREEALRRLARAEVVKAARRELRHALADGSITLHDALHQARATPDCHAMLVPKLLASLPQVGPAKIRRVLRLAQMSHDKPVGALTDRQINVLVDALTR